jgi:hypothetical protein
MGGESSVRRNCVDRCSNAFGVVVVELSMVPISDGCKCAIVFVAVNVYEVTSKAT